MLSVEKTSLGQFGEAELATLVQYRGWRSVLPSALTDQQLLLVADQLRDLLTGEVSGGVGCPPKAALSVTLLLLSKAGIPGKALTDLDMATLHEAMTIFCINVDHEIVSRMLQRRRVEKEPNLVQGLRELVRQRP